MAKVFVIRCVVPPMVSTPAAATTTQNRATSALWRSTKLVSAVMVSSLVGCGGGRRARSSRRRWQSAVPPGDSAAPGLLPREYPGCQPGDADCRLARAYACGMDGVVAAWRRWRGWPGRDVLLVLLVTVLLLLGSYGEAHPRNPADTIQFGHRPVPQPGAAYVLVAIACLALAWRRRRPAAVLAVSAAAAIGYTLLGNVNGSVLVAPVIALYALATQVSARKAVVAGLVTMVVLTAATAARNPFGH